MTDTIEGFQVDLSDSRHVWGGKVKDGYLWDFTNSKGEVTQIHLSNEAMSALLFITQTLNEVPEGEDE